MPVGKKVITDEDISKYGSYNKAYYNLYERERRNAKKRNPEEYKTNEHIREVSKKWYEEHKDKIREYNKERNKSKAKGGKKSKLISKEDIEKYGSYQRAYAHLVRKEKTRVSVR